MSSSPSRISSIRKMFLFNCKRSLKQLFGIKDENAFVPKTKSTP
ncbi:hypothetical protein HanPSC8_Chr13g0569121 [Helianthus annuus]|nr:hypothetical protein HanPSC8_Chr13g0569121 [Helianthus annuus]